MRRVHLDHNATTPMRAEVRDVLLEVLESGAANPSSLHAAGRQARMLVDEARERVAGALGVGEDEILFTSGGTEANNLALFGALGEGAALVTSAVEHSSVLEPAAHLAEAGHPWRRAGVDEQGLVDVDQVVALALAPAEGPAASLVSVMAANNEVGMLQPVAELARRLEAGALAAGLPRPLLHTDAVQALGRLEVPQGAWGAWGPDLASFSAHKLGGPVGVGVLWRRAGVSLRPRLFGGGQEAGLRPGTENVAGIVAASHAIELAVRDRAEFAGRASDLAAALWSGLRDAFPDARLLGPSIDSSARLPGTLNILLPQVEGKVLVTRLDLEGLEVSAGSACASGSLEPSHVLIAMGLDEERARAGLRMSVGRETTPNDVQQAVDIVGRTCG